MYIYYLVNRQRDSQFIALLDRIRRGFTDDLQYINSHFYNIPRQSNGVIKPTKIFTHKRDVEQLNETELLKLPGTLKF